MDWKEVEKLPKEFYAPSHSMEHYDKKTNTYYSSNGSELMHPDCYDYDNNDYDNEY